MTGPLAEQSISPDQERVKAFEEHLMTQLKNEDAPSLLGLAEAAECDEFLSEVLEPNYSVHGQAGGAEAVELRRRISKLLVGNTRLNVQ